jgi:hypothetical protein
VHPVRAAAEAGVPTLVILSDRWKEDMGLLYQHATAPWLQVEVAGRH